MFKRILHKIGTAIAIVVAVASIVLAFASAFIDYSFYLPKVKDTAAHVNPTPSPTNASSNARMEYDAVGRLTKVIYGDGATITYKYDAAGNRTDRIVENPNVKKVVTDPPVFQKH